MFYRNVRSPVFLVILDFNFKSWIAAINRVSSLSSSRKKSLSSMSTGTGDIIGWYWYRLSWIIERNEELTLFWSWHVRFSFRLIPTQLTDDTACEGTSGRKFTGSTQIYGQHVDLRVARKSTTYPLPGKATSWPWLFVCSVVLMVESILVSLMMYLVDVITWKRFTYFCPFAGEEIH